MCQLTRSRRLPRLHAVGIACGLLAAWSAAISLASAAELAAKKVVLLAGTVHQGPGGHPAGTHEYELSVRLLKQSLESATNLPPLAVELHFDGWPRDPATLDDADTIVVLSDGADRKLEDHPLLVGDRLAQLKKQMDRGCGLVAIHWTVFVPRAAGGEEFLDWIGGHFDYESGPAANQWYSKIQTAETRCTPASPEHPISRGLASFALREEYYYNLRFRPNDRRLTPILTTPIPGEQQPQTVAWAVERANGGRGFGFTGGHFFDNWEVDPFRRMVLNAVVWTAHVEVPPEGVVWKKSSAVAGKRAMQAVVVTGHQHPAHAWRDTTAALQEVLSQDKRLTITVVTDPEFLATKQLASYDVVVLNYCNWQRLGLSEAARENFARYLAEGGGLALIHFSNGAFHASLPETPPSDWPEYRNICRRVWDHASGRSSHDPYGRFRVQVTAEHPITAGLNSFDTIDELYANQQGEMPIEVLATAHSTITNRDEPMAFVHAYGRGRVFQTVLGHAADSIRVPGEAALIRRGAVWAAGGELPPDRADAKPVVGRAIAPKLSPEGRFGAALDPRSGAAQAEHRAVYDQLPLTVECWTKLAGKSGFNILVANQAKESGDHWELYSYAETGDLSLYLPGCSPAEIRSGVDIVDGQWHHVGAAFDDGEVALYVDGKLARTQRISRNRRGGPAAPLYFGGYPPHHIGCDGVIDEVRISSGRRPLDATPSAPLVADARTIGLWHFDRIEGDRVEDLSPNANAAKGESRAETGVPLWTRWPADSQHRLTTIDTSLDESFFSLRADTAGRLFVGGREALFVYEPDDRGGYRPRQLLYRFPADSWVTDVEVRGDDLYVMTNAALYLLAGARTRRTGLTPRRLLWGAPVDLHVTYHGLAWGPEGDLYFSSGDPLLNYGDFAARPDHWGHWNVYTQPEGTKVPYTGMGGFFRCQADGSNFRVVAGGTRGSVGVAMDRRWNLFSNDNDHESMADRYSPARLLHAAPEAHFFWPRGWIADMSPERSDLLEIVNTGLGREVPCGQAYYDDPRLGEAYRDSLLLARWGQRRVDAFKLEPRGASYQASERPLLLGTENARPVGVTVGRGGTVFVAISYMAGNEWSPKYPSELVMITPVDDPPAHRFDAYEATTASPERLWSELSNDSWSRRERAHGEILRRGGALLTEAVARLKGAEPSDRTMMHLPWLAAASGRVEARDELLKLARHADAAVRLQAIRALGEFRALNCPRDVIVEAVADRDPQVRRSAIATLLVGKEPLGETPLSSAACSQDTYLRQAAAFLLARRGNASQIERWLDSPSAAQRLAGVLAAGFRLSVPNALDPLPEELPLHYESKNAKFVVDYADATVDLKSLGSIGSFTIAERWKHVRPSADESRLFERLVERLSDADDRVAQQAGYFLSLLDDPRAEPLVARSRQVILMRRLNAAPARAIDSLWQIGPLDADSLANGPERGPIDLASPIAVGPKQREWHAVNVHGGVPLSKSALNERAVSYVYFRLATLDPLPAWIRGSIVAETALWHNGRPIESTDGGFVLALEPGSNDILMRVQNSKADAKWPIHYQSPGRVEAVMPEKLLGLADRLAAGSSSTADAVPSEFLGVDWVAATRSGDPERGRKLFSADALACVRCHAIRANQKGGGGPSLAGAASRFTVAHLVESIMAPSKQVAPIFATTSIVTDDGRSISGLVVEENEKNLVLLLPSAARQSVELRSVEARQVQATSPMPAGLVKSPAELGDLLAYLLSADPQAP
jgi:putative heme-binding domain-containing protein